MDDAHLIEALIELDPAAWLQFDRRFKRRLLDMFSMKGVANEDLHDCYQDFCVALMEGNGRKLEQWRAESSLLTWLLAAARNRAIDWVRQTKRHLDPWDEETVDAHVDPALAPANPGPDAIESARQLKAQLTQALEELAPRERDVIRLRYIEEQSVADTAAVLGITANNVYQICFRAADKLRGLLRDDHPFGRSEG